jgi:hypothetical protein
VHFQAPAEQDQPSCSLEIWLQPGSTTAANTILAFSTPENHLLLSLHQYRAILILNRQISNDPNQAETIGIDGVFRQIKPMFITITSGPQKTSMYVEGTLVNLFRNFGLEGIAPVAW